METLKLVSPENLYLLIPTGLLIIAGLLVHFALRKRFELFLLRSRAKLFSRLRGSAASAVKISLLGLTLIFLVLTLSRPVIVKPNYHQNFLVLMDLSRSISVEDYRLDGNPASRLKMTQTTLKNLLDELPPEARLGVATFVGNIYQTSNINLIRTLPQTVGSSREELKQLIDWISWSQASISGTPIQRAVAEITAYIKKHPEILGDNLTVILITDGEENVPPSPLAFPNHFYHHRKNDEKKNLPESRNTSAKEKTAKDSKFRFVIVGIGTPTGGPIPKFDQDWNFIGYEQDYSGRPQISRRDDNFLTKLSQKLGAEYLKIDGPDDLKILATDPKYKTAVSDIQKDLSIYTILAALIFFLAALVL